MKCGFVRERKSEGSAPVSLWVGRDTALTAIGSRSRPCRRFAPPRKPFLRKDLQNPKNFQKMIFNHTFLKVFGDPRTFAIFAAGKFTLSASEEVFKKVLGRRRPLPVLHPNKSSNTSRTLNRTLYLVFPVSVMMPYWSFVKPT